jgi:ketosteroid isomerase-like protein
MEAKPQLEQSMQEEQIRAALNKHWHASAVGDANAEHDIYDDDAICDYPQSGERILGRSNLHNHVPGATSIHSEYYGVPQRKGRARDTVFRGSLRSARLAEPMG